MNAALKRSKGTFLTDDETAELKKLYRSIVKSLHPDLNPDLTDAQITLFHNAVNAYENGDIQAIRAIAVMVSAPPTPQDNVDGIKLLIKEKERFLSLLQSIKDSIANIKSTYPYTMRPIIQDEKKTAERKAELETIIAEWEDALAAYTTKIKEMME